MHEPNAALRAARERRPSPRTPNAHLTRAELAEAVNAWLWESTGTRYDLDDHLIGKWERGVVRRPIVPYRAALRAVLGVASHEELGFAAYRRATADEDAVPAWTRGRIVADATRVLDDDMITRRDAVRGMAGLSGVALLSPLAAWLEPLVGEALVARRGPFAVAEVDAVERVVATFRSWRSAGSGLGRSAVLGQLADVAERVRDAPSGPLADRMALAAAELAKIAGSMAFDAGHHRAAQRDYVLAVRLAKVGDNPSFAATTLAALARQSFDLGRTGDGLEIIALARHGSGDVASPALHAMLATREAWGHAQRGEVYAFRRSVDEAEQAHEAVDPTAEPRWLRGLDRAELAGVIGARYRDLARFDVRHADRAVGYVERALALRHPARPRNRGFDLVSLARVHLLTGDHDRGVAAVRDALPLIDQQRPGRLARKLQDWYREAHPVAAPAVRAARNDIAAALRSTA